MGLDINELLEENERLSTQGNTGFYDNFVMMPKSSGVVIVRLLSPAPAGMFGREKNPFYQATRVHKLNDKSYQCLKQLEGKQWKGDCPVCKYYSWLWQQSEKQSTAEADQTQAQARAIKPIERYYYNVLVRQQVNQSGEVETNVGPKILSIGKILHQRIITAIVGDKELNEAPLGDVTDEKQGRDLKIIKTMRQSGRDSYPNYSDSKFLECSPLGNPDQVKEWMSNLHDLGKLRENGLLDAEGLKIKLKIHLGLIPDEDSDGWNPAEFQSNDQTVQTSQLEITQPVVTTVEVVKPQEEKSDVVKGLEEEMGMETTSYQDDDFIKQIQGLKIN